MKSNTPLDPADPPLPATGVSPTTTSIELPAKQTGASCNSDRNMDTNPDGNYYCHCGVYPYGHLHVDVNGHGDFCTYRYSD